MSDTGRVWTVEIIQGGGMSIDPSYQTTITTTIPTSHRPPDPSSDTIVETIDPSSDAASMNTGTIVEINHDIPMEYLNHKDPHTNSTGTGNISSDINQ